MPRAARVGQTGRVGTGASRLAALACATVLAAAAAVLPTMSSAGAAGGTWSTVSVSPPQYAQVFSMTCPTTTVCYALASTGYSAVGGRNLIVSSTDGSATWTIRYTAATDLLLVGLVCTSASVCSVGIGPGGPGSPKLLTTSDGGTSWSAHTLPGAANAVLGGVWCESSASCDVAIQSGSSTVSLLSTRDGGQTWTAHRSAILGIASGLSCIAMSECFLGVSEEPGSSAGPYDLERTTDSGGAWTAQTLPTHGLPLGLPEVACTTLHRCVMTDAEFGEGGLVFATSNGGNRWRLVEQGMTWVRPAACDMHGDCAIALGSVASHALVALSVDAGATWRLRSFSRDLDAGSAACGSPTFCVVATLPALEFSDAVSFFDTADGGGHWARSYVQRGVTSLNGVDCPNATTCTVVGGATSGSLVESSSDAGATWVIHPPSPGLGTLGSISCVSASVCLATWSSNGTGFGLVRTTDGGVTWAAVTLPGQSPPFESVTCTSATTCFVIGAYPVDKLDVSSNAGMSWTISSLPTAIGSYDYLDSVSCLTTTKCVAVATEGSRPVFLSSANGGRTWVTTQKVATADLWDFDHLSCWSALNCVSIATAFTAPGNETTLLYLTSNAGKTWSPRAAFGTKYVAVTGLQCMGGGACEATASNQGAVSSSSDLSSSDGGLTWSAAPMPIASVASMSCSSASACVAVGLRSDGAWEIVRRT